MPLPVDVEATIDPRRSVLLPIDMQRRHLDVGGVGYHTLPAERAKLAVERGGVALQAARDANMPVVHVGTWSMTPAPPWGPREGRNPFWAWQNGKPIPGAGFVRQATKCVEGSPYAEFMPPEQPLPHEPVVVKRRYSGFYMTDLELILRSFGVDTIFIIGVNTNNCCLHTAFDAQARDFRVVLLEDACGSMNGQEYHEAAVKQIEAAIGWVISVADFTTLIEKKAGALVG
ncbi:MAG TPA: isochorismatase family cysteine hydrolase [Thermomicrobiaceae bacterium]|nr:isochorismatase family cysteine hydrolase [Thermomicrobiaceae bacterium]